MIDMHCHLLPGIDDGPQTLDAAVAMCRMAADDGVKVAVTTPHIHPGRWPNTRDVIARGRDELQNELVKQGVDLQLGYAAEVRLSDHLMEQVQRDQIPFYGEVDGYKIMLLEFPHGHIVPGSQNMVRWLLERGIRPMIAHPERNKQVMKNPAAMDPFIEAGCWLQGTAGSLIGKFGEPAQQVIEELLLAGKLTVIASDGHNLKARPPTLSAAFTRAQELVGYDIASKLFLKHKTDQSVAA
ncbi:CpsB/CapC family capsule biosynthesis tyrosine phosphatase [Congregibacter variabilis]|uniref:protein-tyrosine-phosphatase n=1 Tax=Congregibacter variabilis TaxID=3081200 RepID=A0ABZ0I5H9_9GAMM|nr:CpsB/CapC family capsule biosynthesis tyrosine phosphatase [Congregibacter sp. IMCC43200]